MAKQNIKSKKGFTIIEVVLVLAIAGLIFLMVFVAYPALARTQRDTQRRNDYAMLSTAVTNFMTNSRGKLPIGTDGACSSSFEISKNIGDEGKDPNGIAYDVKCYSIASGSLTNATTPKLLTTMANNAAPVVYILGNADCGTDGLTPTYNSGSRSFAIYGQLESGTYCNASN